MTKKNRQRLTQIFAIVAIIGLVASMASGALLMLI